MTDLDVTVRINIEGRKEGGTDVRVHGWIEGEDEARELIRVVRNTPAPVVLDLGELQTADTVGLKALNTLASEGARLTQASDFIKLLLKSSGPSSSVETANSNGGAP